MPVRAAACVKAAAPAGRETACLASAILPQIQSMESQPFVPAAIEAARVRSAVLIFRISPLTATRSICPWKSPLMASPAVSKSR